MGKFIGIPFVIRFRRIGYGRYVGKRRGCPILVKGLDFFRRKEKERTRHIYTLGRSFCFCLVKRILGLICEYS